MKNIDPILFLIGFLMIAIIFSCNNNYLNEKQVELDRNRALWESYEVNHYRLSRIIPPCLCDQIAGYPHVISISNNKIYAIALETNSFDERDFEYVSNLWQNNRYLISNTFEFSSNHFMTETIEQRFNIIQSFINEAKNDTSINHLSGHQNYTIDVTYNQEYGYPVKMSLFKLVPTPDFSYPIISNLQILN